MLKARIPCPIFKTSQNAPNKIAIFSKNQSISYVTLNQRISQLSHYLAQRSHVFFTNSQDIDTICLFFAALRNHNVVYVCPPIMDVPHQEALNKSDFININPFKKHKEKKATKTTTKEPKIITLDTKAPATLLQSSGTSNTPKLVCHSLANHYYSYLGLLEKIPFESKDCWALMLPLHHISGLSILFRVFFAGACLCLVNHYKQPWWQQSDNISHASMVPAQVFELKHQKSPLKHLLLGGSHISETCIKQASKLSKNVYISYGSTETASQVCVQKMDKVSSLCVGAPHSYCNLKLSAKKHLLIEGKTCALGYFKLPNSLIRLKQPFDSGDLATQKNTIFSILGRADHMFISGGENIYPEAIEAAFLKHPNINVCICIPKDDEKFGQVPVLYVQSDKKLLDLNLKEWAKAHLVSFKIPKVFYAWPKEIIENKHSRMKINAYFQKNRK